MSDWARIILALIPTIPATLALIFGYLNRKSLKTPSGDRIGAVVERTHDLAAVATMANVRTVEQQPGMDKVEARLNANPDSAVTINGPRSDPASP